MLSRKVGEEIIIDHPDLPERIVISYVNHTGRNQIKLGVKANHEVTINRREIQEKVDKENGVDFEARLPA